MSCRNIKVAIKARPIIKKEKDMKLTSQWKIVDNSIRQIESQSEPFYFDHIFDQDVSNRVIFDTVAKPIVDAALKGFNGTIFAYGQTCSGKTYTMLGDEKDPGVMMLAAKEIFREIELAMNRQFLLRVGYIEIYNEKIFDLLHKSNQDLKIHETSNGDVTVNCEEFIITSESKLIEYLQAGSKHRKVGETNMNERSSRSHAIFRIIIESREVNKSPDEGSVQISNLNLVDLAGSERADQTGATGSRLKEGASINKSLLYLSCVINKLSENESAKYINYRDSKLTRILQASLGGNALTAIICNINPTAIEETNSTLSFAMRAKAIKNKPQVNEVLSDAALMKRLEREIARLESELLVERMKNSKIKVIQLEKQIYEEELKIVHSHAHVSKKDMFRRRTWSACVNTEKTKENTAVDIVSDAAVPVSQFMTPLVTLRNQPLSTLEEFKTSDNIDFDDFFVDDFSNIMKTPEVFKHSHRKNDSNIADNNTRCMLVEQELEELIMFTNLERKYNVEHDLLACLKNKLEDAQIRIKKYQEELLNIQLENWNEKEENLNRRCLYLENQITEQNKVLNAFKEKEEGYESKLKDSKQKIQNLELELNEKNSMEYEQEQQRHRAKVREKELLEVLSEKDQLIKTLNDKVKFQKDVKSEASSDKFITPAEYECKETFCEDLAKASKENIRKLNDKCEQYEKIFEDLQKSVQKLHEEKEVVQNENDELSTQLMEAIQENDSLRNENAELKTEMIQLRMGIINEKTTLKEGTGEDSFENIHDELNALISTSTLSSEEILKLSRKVLSLEFELNKHKKENCTLRDKIKILEETERYRVDNLNSSENLNDALKKSVNEVNDLKSEFNVLRSKQKATQEENIKLINEISLIKEQLKISMNENNNLKEQVNFLDVEKNECLLKLSSMKILEQSLKEEIDELNAKVAFLKSKDNQMLTETSCLLKKMSSFEIDMNKKSSEITNLHDQIEKLEKKKEEYMNKLSDLEPIKASNDLLTTEIRDTKMQISIQLDTMNDLYDQISFLQCQINRKKALSVIKQDGINISPMNSDNLEIISVSSKKSENTQSFKAIDVEMSLKAKEEFDPETEFSDITSVSNNLTIKIVDKLTLICYKIQQLDQKLKNFENKYSLLKLNIEEGNDIKRNYIKVISDQKLLAQLSKTLQSQVMDKLGDMNFIIEQLVLKLENMEKLRDKLKDEFENYRCRLEAQAEQVSLLKSKNENIISAYNEATTLNEQLKTEICAVKTENNELKHSNNKPENLSNNENLVTEISSQQRVIAELENKITLLESEKNTIINEYKSTHQLNPDSVLLKIENENLGIKLKSQEVLNKTIEESNNKIKDLLVENKLLHSEKSRLKSDHDLIKGICEGLESQLKLLNESKTDLTHKMEELSSNIKVLKEENELLVSQSNDLKSKISEEKDLRTNLTEELELLKDAGGLLENRIQQYEKNAEHAQENNNLNEELKKSIEKNDSLLNEVKSLKELKNELEKKFDKCQEENLDLKKVVTESNSLIKQTEEECKVLRLSTDSLAHNVMKLEQERNCLLEEKDNVEKEILTRQEKINALEEEITNVKSQNIIAIKKIKNLEQEYCTFETKYDERVALCCALEKDVQTIKRELQQSEMKNKVLQSQKDELNAKINILEEQNQQLLKNVENAESKMSKFLIEQNTLLLDNRTLLQEKLALKSLEKEIEEKSNHIKNLECKTETYSKTFDEIEVLKLELNRRNKECSYLQEELNIMIARNKNLDIIKQSLEKTQDQFNIECRERKKFQNKAEELSKEFQKLKGEYNSCLVQLRDYNNCNVDENFERDAQGDTKANLNSPNKNLLKQLHEMQKMHLFKTAQLQSKIDLLEARNTELLQKNSKSYGNASKECLTTRTDIIKQGLGSLDDKEIIESLLGENKQLKIKNEKLIAELDGAKKVSQQDRKSRRQSTHDEKRQSLWDHSRDIGIMTQPTDKLCNCEQLDLKVKELKKTLKIKECQVNTFFLELKSNPLTDENEKLKTLLLEEEAEEKKLRIEISKLKQKLMAQINEKKECSTCLLNSKKIYVHTAVQAENQATGDNCEVFAKLQRKYDDLKNICRMRREIIEELEAKISREKENQANNQQNTNEKNNSATQLANYEKLYISLQGEYDILRKKYEQCKFICISRREEIKSLEAKLMSPKNY